MTKAREALVGQVVKCVRPMTQAELAWEGWDDKDWCTNAEETVAIEFENGTVIYPSRDPEGNDGGTLFGNEKKGRGKTKRVEDFVLRCNPGKRRHPGIERAA